MTISLTDLSETLGLTKELFGSEQYMKYYESDIIEAAEYFFSDGAKPKKATTQNQFGTLCVFLEYTLGKLSIGSNSMNNANKAAKTALKNWLRRGLRAKYLDTVSFYIHTKKNRIHVKLLVTLEEVEE